VTVAGTVTANPTGTQTVAGTVTASLANVVADDEYHGLPHVRVNGGLGQGVELCGIDADAAQISIMQGGGIPVYPRDNTAANAPFPVAGTVTVGNTVTVAGTVTANPTGTQTVAGTVTASLADVATNDVFHALPHVRVNGGYGQGVELAGIDASGNPSNLWEGGGIPVFPRDVINTPFPVAGTVAVGNLPSGALTTRFGSVTTAGTAQLTTAVTNANRKYLLLQNISTGAVTVGVGFVPTTTQGIALAAGAGLTFDAFCPTGAVHWLGGTAGAPFTILEG
jgi:hypothetical protein